MPNQHSPAKQAVTHRLPRELVAAVREAAAEQSITVTEFVENALNAALTQPPP